MSDPSSQIGQFVIGVSSIGGPVFGRATPGITQTIPSYLYVQYNDDDDLQSFVTAYNQMTQRYIDWLNFINLPVYTGDQIFGGLLDWVAQGLYGMKRPTLASGLRVIIGPYNTYGYNHGITYNSVKAVGPSVVYTTSDDIFKRILTWHLYKGDGKQFTIRWLKRRIMRFLTGINGTPGQVDTSYRVSVTFGVNHQANIRLLNSITAVSGGALYGRFTFNSGRPFNQLVTLTTQHFAPLPFQDIFKAAVDSGVLELPFQWQFIVTIVA